MAIYAFLVAVHYVIFFGYNFVCKFGEYILLLRLQTTVRKQYERHKRT